MFGCLLGWYAIYTFSGLLQPSRILPGAKFILRPKSCILQFWQRYCTALEQWTLAKLCGMVQGIELWNFRSSSFSTEGATYIPRVAITLFFFCSKTLILLDHIAVFLT